MTWSQFKELVDAKLREVGKEDVEIGYFDFTGWEGPDYTFDFAHDGRLNIW